MFDVGWSEMLVIGVIAVLVIGPKDIPKIMYQVGRFMRRLQYMRFAMSQQFDEVLKAGDIEELRRGVNFEARKADEKSVDEEYPEPPKPPEPQP
jgi:sec-independent protein translocase protein TatB